MQNMEVMIIICICLVNGTELYTKYTMYAKKEDQFQKKIFNPLNWQKDERGDYLRIIQHYISEESIGGHQTVYEIYKVQKKRIKEC